MQSQWVAELFQGCIIINLTVLPFTGALQQTHKSIGIALALMLLLMLMALPAPLQLGLAVSVCNWHNQQQQLLQQHTSRRPQTPKSGDTMLTLAYIFMQKSSKRDAQRWSEEWRARERLALSDVALKQLHLRWFQIFSQRYNGSQQQQQLLNMKRKWKNQKIMKRTPNPTKSLIVPWTNK